MSKTNESKIYNLIRSVLNNATILRVETYTQRGVPDLYLCRAGKSVWIELKSNNLKNLGLSGYQVNWIVNHQRNGGSVYVLNGIRNEGVKERALKLYRIQEPSRLVREVLSTTYDSQGMNKVLDYVFNQ